MAVVKWSGALTSRGSVLTTQLNTLTNGSLCSAGSAYDNTSNLDRWGWVEFAGGGSITPTAGAYISVYIVTAPGGTNYDDAASSTNPGTHQLVAVLSVQTGAHTVRAISAVPFALPPTLFKFVLKNGTGVSLTASGNTLTLYTGNEAIA